MLVNSTAGNLLIDSVSILVKKSSVRVLILPSFLFPLATVKALTRCDREKCCKALNPITLFQIPR